MNRDFLTWQVSSEKSEFRQINQDAFFAANCCFNKKEYAVFCIADGMGGRERGELASRLAVSMVEQWFKMDFLDEIEGKINIHHIRCILFELFRNINDEMIERYKKKGIDTGTTLSLLLLSPRHYFFAHCGDSRIYLFKKETFYQITEDHTEKMYRHKWKITGHEQESAKGNALMSCLGMIDDPEIQTGAGELYGKDGFLLLSDGVYRFVAIEDCTDFMEAAELTRLALQQNGTDNATAITVKLQQTGNHFLSRGRYKFR